MPLTVVVALGGNALGNNAQEQLERARTAASAIADLVKMGYRVVVSHGNGPQVGMIKLCLDKGSAPMPLAECTAMSQGYIGYHLQQALQAELTARGIDLPVATLITQVVVSENDPAYQHPTKPIGEYYDEQTAAKLMAETNRTYVDDAGRGWRWVVPSPKPVDIIEKDTVKYLLDNGRLVITCGGGGVPVVKDAETYRGTDAVIDKDFAAAKLAELINADCLFILTAVDRVSINFKKPDEKKLEHLTVAEAEAYAQQGHFAPGSMLPKVEAGMQFARSGQGRKAIIGALEQASLALSGQSGTEITLN